MARSHVLITSVLPDAGMTVLKKHFRVTSPEENQPFDRQGMIDRLKDAKGLICMLSDRIDREIFEQGSKLKVIANYAVGYNNIDIDEATSRGIAVANTPDVLTNTTADLTFALILGISRRIVEADSFVRSGAFSGWSPKLMLGTDIYGKTIGIIGFGRIGQAVAQRAKGFGMHILYYEPEPKSYAIERTFEAFYCDLALLLSEADFVSVHVPLNDETYHMISDREFSRMKPSAFLINVARGPVVDEKALIRALTNGIIAGCALDVYEHEPAVTGELIAMKNTVLVPHIGSATAQTRDRMAVMVAESMVSVLVRDECPVHIVNPQIYPS